MCQVKSQSVSEYTVLTTFSLFIVVFYSLFSQFYYRKPTAPLPHALKALLCGNYCEKAVKVPTPTLFYILQISPTVSWWSLIGMQGTWILHPYTPWWNMAHGLGLEGFSSRLVATPGS